MSISSTEALAMLRSAFPRVPIEMDRAFSDWGRTYPDARAYRDFAEGRTWEELDRSYLERRDDALGFLGTDALADILPAALAALLGDGSPHRAFPYTLAVILTRPRAGERGGLGPRRFDALLARLSEDQQRAVATALRCFLELHPEAGPSDGLADAMESHWGHLDPQPQL